MLSAYARASLTAHRLAPAWLGSVVNMAVAHTLLEQPEAAHKYATLAEDLGIPSSAAPLSDVFAQLAMREGRVDQAADFAVAGLPPGMAADGGADTVRQVFTVPRDRTAVDALVDALNGLRARTAPPEMTQMMKRRFTVWYTMLGALDEAFEVMTESLDYFARSGTIGTAWAFLWMPEMLPFRQDPRFQSLCRRMGLFDYWSRYGPPDNCELQGDRLICF